MQTFLPYPDFAESARCLDRQRLGKQIVEVVQILQALKNPTVGRWHRRTKAAERRAKARRLWALRAAGKHRLARARVRGYVHHPAVRMWRDHDWQLINYGNTCHCALIWLCGTVSPFDQLLEDAWCEAPWSPTPPPWLGDPAFHASHRSNLLRKDPEHYGKFGWSEPDNLPYVWPAH
jgi:hypothetical protein